MTAKKTLKRICKNCKYAGNNTKSYYGDTHCGYTHSKEHKKEKAYPHTNQTFGKDNCDKFLPMVAK